MGVRSVACLLLLGFAPACGETAAPPPANERGASAIRIASFDFGESEIVAEIYAQALEGADLPVSRFLNAGPRETVLPALEQDRVDLVPEYLGTALRFVSLGVGHATADPADTHAKLSNELADRQLSALPHAPGQNRNEFVVLKETADEYDLDEISDLEEHENSMTLGGPPECPARPLCLQGLGIRYGLDFGSFLPLDAGGPLTVAALDTGEVDVAVLFSTDPELNRPDLVVLEDDRALQPAENLVPVVRTEMIGRFGNRFMSTVNSVTERLTTAELRELNRQIEILDLSVAEIAAEWLRSKGLS